MSLKKHLIATAAVLIMGGTAYSADAVVAPEPEAVEYVRVCDAYGEGLFYIPGTETCLKIGGYVRFDVGYGDLLGLDRGVNAAGNVRPYGFATGSEFDLQISTSSETDLGTLSTYAEANFFYGDQRSDDDFANGRRAILGSSVSLYYAYIELGGLRVGLDDSVFSYFVDYAGNVLNDDLIGYGPFETTLISYSFDAGNGFSAIAALEDDAGAGSGYVPNIVVGAKYTTDTFGVSAVVAYEEAIRKATGKLRVDATVGKLSLFAMAGLGSTIIDAATGDEIGQIYKGWGGKWAVWGGGSYALTEKAKLNAQLSYDAAKNFAAVGNVEYELAPSFTITSELGYYDTLADKGIFGGQLRFERSF